jgi:hypothetical protein
MAAFDFPNSPTVGDVYTVNGVSYRWDGVAWMGGPAVSPDKASFSAHRSGGGNVALGTALFTKIPLTTLVVNQGGWVITGGEITVPKTGVYLLGGSIVIQTAAAIGNVLGGLFTNGAPTTPFIVWRDQNTVAVSNLYTQSISKILNVNAGVTLGLSAYSGAAGAVVLDVLAETYLWAVQL